MGNRINISGVVFNVDDVIAIFPKAGRQEVYLPLEAAADVRAGDRVSANFDQFGKVTSVMSKSGRLWKPQLVTVFH